MVYTHKPFPRVPARLFLTTADEGILQTLSDQMVVLAPHTRENSLKSMLTKTLPNKGSNGEVALNRKARAAKFPIFPNTKVAGSSGSWEVQNIPELKPDIHARKNGVNVGKA
jgi:hypothetical protein